MDKREIIGFTETVTNDDAVYNPPRLTASAEQ